MGTMRHYQGCIVQRMTRIVGLLCLVFFAGFATSQAKEAKTEHLNFSLPWKPKLGHQAEGPNQYAIFEFIREEDDINNWQELVTMQNFSKSWGGSSPEDAFNSLRVIRETKCPGQTKWNVLKKDENSILYEWQAKPCMGWPEQHEIAKIIDGQYNRFRLAYTAKTYRLSPGRRTEWIKIISESKVVKD